MKNSVVTRSCAYSNSALHALDRYISITEAHVTLSRTLLSVQCCHVFCTYNMASLAELSSDRNASSGYYDILLVGRTGMGKSTTGNTLLGRVEGAEERFATGDGSESVTTQCELLPSINKIRVLDTPGFANTQLTKEHGPLECNLQIFRWILQEQEKHDLAFRRVLYFLPNRGPLERAEGALQEEIKVMYDFLGKDIFNVMIIIATNQKDEKYQIEFDEEDITTTMRVFTAAFERVTGISLPNCPPVLYLPFDETDAINKIVTVEVIADEPLKKKASAQPEKEEEPVVIEVSQNIPIDELICDAKQKNPGKKLQFQDRCTRCAGKLIYEDSPTGKRPVKIVYESGGEVPLEQSKCHPIFIPKHYTITKIIGGIAHILTLGIVAGIGAIRGKAIWPGFTNSDEICPVCSRSPGSEGCSVVGKMAEILAKSEEKEQMVAHSTSLDKVQIETALL